MENQVNPSEDRLNTSFFDFEKKTAPFRRYLGNELGHAKRSIAFVQGEYFLILDEVKGQVLNGEKLDGKFDVYFHGGRSMLEQNENAFTWSYEDDRYGDSAKLLSYQLSPGADISVTEGESTYIKADYGSFPTLRTTMAGHEALFGQILFPLGENDTQPDIEDLSTEKLLGAKIIMGETTDIFLKSRTEKKSSDAGLSFDGDFAWVSLESDKLVKAAGQSVKSLSYDEVPVLISDQRITFALRMDETIELGISLEKPSKLVINLNQAVSTVTRDGNSVPFENVDGSLVIEISQSGNYLIN